MSITDLPPDLISEILNYLNPKDLGIVSCVSTTLRYVAPEHHVWKEFYCVRWGSPNLSAAPFGAERSWKELFVEKELRSKAFLGRYSTAVIHINEALGLLTVCVLASAELIFSAGVDRVVRMWDMEEGFPIASSRKLGTSMRELAVDSKLLVAGGFHGIIHCWKVVEGLHHLFDLNGTVEPDNEVRLQGHEATITSLLLDLTGIYSASFDMTVRVWDRSSLRCTRILRLNNNWVPHLIAAPHNTTVVFAAGPDVLMWEMNKRRVFSFIHKARFGTISAWARSPNGEFLFITGGGNPG